LKAPAGGFEDQKISALFFPQPAATGSASTPSSTSPPKGTKKENKRGEIAGVVVGAIVLLGLVGGLAAFFIFRKRSQQAPLATDPEKKYGGIGDESLHELHEVHYAELEGKHDYNEMPTTVMHHELPADECTAELDAKSSVPYHGEEGIDNS
jgi:hypothetical protein